MLEQATSLSSDKFSRLLMFVWSLWKNRNEKLWNEASQPSPVIISTTMAWYESFLQANQSTIGLSFCPAPQNKSWVPPTGNCVLLNVDGSYLPNSNIGGMGGVLRNGKGKFLAGFSSRLNFVVSAFHVELLAIQAGLKFLQTMKISCGVVHSDCLLAVQAIQGNGEDLSPLGNLIENIKDLLHTLPGILVGYAARTTNLVAHRLANFSYESNVHLEWFSNAPDFLLDALIYDFHRI